MDRRDFLKAMLASAAALALPAAARGARREWALGPERTFCLLSTDIPGITAAHLTSIMMDAAYGRESQFVIDYEHGQLADDGAPWAGVITSLSMAVPPLSRTEFFDGAMHARIDCKARFTRRAEQALKHEGCCYISPCIILDAVDATGTRIAARLWSAALTARPMFPSMQRIEALT